MTQASTITLQQVKGALKVTHAYDDADLDRLLKSATQEALRFMGRKELPTLPLDTPVDLDGDCSSEVVPEEIPSSEDPVADDVANAIILLVRADYEGDPKDRKAYRDGAESLLWPYRISIGV